MLYGFLINDIAKNSIKQAMAVEQLYDNNRLSGLMSCSCKTENLINSDVKNLVELFEMHDQIFILKDVEVYKLHIQRECPQVVLELNYLICRIV